jgi:hypothetical protein
MSATVPQPQARASSELFHWPIIDDFEASQTMTARRGSAATPLSTADQNNALIASIRNSPWRKKGDRVEENHPRIQSACQRRISRLLLFLDHQGRLPNRGIPGDRRA